MHSRLSLNSLQLLPIQTERRGLEVSAEVFVEIQAVVHPPRAAGYGRRSFARLAFDGREPGAPSLARICLCAKRGRAQVYIPPASAPARPPTAPPERPWAAGSCSLSLRTAGSLFGEPLYLRPQISATVQNPQDVDPLILNSKENRHPAFRPHCPQSGNTPWNRRTTLWEGRQRTAEPINPRQVAICNFEARLFRNVAEQRIKVLDGFRPEVDLVPL